MSKIPQGGATPLGSHPGLAGFLAVGKLVYAWISSFAFSAIFLTATPKPARGFARVATITSRISGAMRAMLRERRERKFSSTFSFFWAAWVTADWISFTSEFRSSLTVRGV